MSVLRRGIGDPQEQYRGGKSEVYCEKQNKQKSPTPPGKSAEVSTGSNTFINANLLMHK